jgi:drug/metabolite transporter (DMT)-like permease
MIKLLLILFIGLVFESTGIVFLKKGISQLGGLNAFNLVEMLRIVRAGLTNSQVLLGVWFEALFFACLLVLMSKRDISFLWPLTALSFVFATFAAIWFLHERVSWVRWVGVVFIMLGAALITYSEKHKPSPPAPAPPSPPAARGSVG